MRKRVVVSQRCDPVVGRDETRDALDIHLSGLLWELNFLPVPMTSAISDHEEYIQASMPDAVVLSGGSNIGQTVERDRLETALLLYATTNDLPVLGICRGMQMINHHQGGNLRHISGHVAVRHLIFGPLAVPSQPEVNSFHNIGIVDNDLGNDLEAVAWSNDGAVEALRHRKLPWLGIMWHPERDTPATDFDQTLIRRHLEFLR